MARKGAKNLNEILFGSKTKSEIIYLLWVFRGLWVSITDLAGLAKVDYKTANLVLKTLVKTGEVERMTDKRILKVKSSRFINGKGRVVCYRLKLGSLSKSLTPLMSELFKDRRLEHRGQEYWMIRHYEMKNELFHYFRNVEGLGVDHLLGNPRKRPPFIADTTCTFGKNEENNYIFDPNRRMSIFPASMKSHFIIAKFGDENYGMDFRLMRQYGDYDLFRKGILKITYTNPHDGGDFRLLRR